MFSIQNILLITIFVILTWKIISMLFFRDSGIPGPKGNPIIGQLLEIRSSKDIMQTFADWTRTYGPIIEFRPLGIFGSPVVIIADADAVKQIVITNSFKYKRPPTLAEALPLAAGKNVLLSNGKEHVQQRKLVNPVFKVSNLKGMVDVFEKNAKLLVKIWTNTITSSDSNQTESNLLVQEDLMHLTLDAIAECTFGYLLNSLTDGHNQVSSAFAYMLEGINFKNQFKNIPILRNLPTNAKKREQEAMKVTSEVISEIIRKKLKRRENQKDDDIKRKDLLDLLIEEYNECSGQRLEDELRSQLFVFMLAGYETTSVALAWTSYFFALYPEVQEKARREIEETLKDNDLEWDAFESMEYLAAVINESLRLCTPIPLFRREVIKEDNILGCKVQPGSQLFISPYLLHRRPEYWKDPEKFNPDRFLAPDKDENPSHHYAFQPFSSGPRTCVGYRFALMELKVVLSILLQNFSFSMIPGRSFQGTLVFSYKPKPSLELLVRKR